LCILWGNSHSDLWVHRIKEKQEENNKISNLPEVVQIFTDPLIRNKGIGNQLLYYVEYFLQGKNISQYYLKYI